MIAKDQARKLVNRLRPRFSSGASVEQTAGGWRLQIPAGPAGAYRLAQFDDYASLARKDFAYQPPTRLNLRCRASANGLPGTWGFGFWNDPFALSFGLGGMARRLPALPNACWFFHASAENHLSFQKGQPGSGFLAQSFRSPKIPSVLLAPGAVGLPLFFSQRISGWLRRLAGKIIAEEGRLLTLDATEWHNYTLDWQTNKVVFRVDGETVLESAVSPQGPLGVVIWIDNQYAAWKPASAPGMGTLAQVDAGWLEIEGLTIDQSSATPRANRSE